MSHLRVQLERLGLSQYFDVFVAEGFDTWDTVLDITESDLSHLNVKLGHRRKLQRAIAESRGQSSDRPLPISLGRTTSGEGSFRSDDSATEGKTKTGEAAATGAAATSAKRKYRRHPKPDEHAPERPPSAYVIFSNQVRESLKGQDLSFTEIAKVVGERWQILPANEREACERQANGAKEKYYAQLADYKKTSQYEIYQKYLEDFKAKHAAPTKGKRSKLETESSTGSARSSSHDQAGGRVSSAPLDTSVASLMRAASSEPLGPSRLPAAPSFASKPTSPISHPHALLGSPGAAHQYSPVSPSPRSAGLQRDSVFDVQSSARSRDLRAHADVASALQSPAYSSQHGPGPQTALSAQPFATHYTMTTHSRRPMREPAGLPPLTHEDTTLSSDSNVSGPAAAPSGFPPPGLSLDPGKNLRILPKPVPNLPPLSSPLDRTPLAAHLQSHYQDHRTQGPLAALVRAGELASKVDEDVDMDKGASP